MRRNRTVEIALAACLLVAAVSGTAAAAATRPDAAGLPGRSSAQRSAPHGPDGFAEDYPYFAGYHERVSGPAPISIGTVTEIVDPGRCAEPAIVSASVSIFDADYDVAAAYATSSCYLGDPVLAIDLIAPNGTSHRRSLGVEVGDRIALSASVDGNGTRMTATNLTKGWTEKLTGPTFDPQRVAVGAVTGYDSFRRLPIPDFGSMPFTETAVDGEPLRSIGPRPLDLYLDDSGQRMTVGRIHDGTDFRVRSHNT